MKPHSSSKAFSLIELLIVISVIGILLAIAAPNVFSLLNAHTLTGEGTLLRNKLTLAQQKALSGNADVEFRFFKMADLENAESESQYRSFQLFMHNSVGEMEPITELLRIKPPVYINERMSTLIEGGTASGKYEVTEGGKKVER
ncbi:MAG TPA: Verru_Chthon cassette protein D, partial [Verrucomicrobiales bacterium]|nr:Verru_Chthon cassette protein D [Verrucomicrobiales bacterium]